VLPPAPLVPLCELEPWFWAVLEDGDALEVLLWSAAYALVTASTPAAARARVSLLMVVSCIDVQPTGW
jgi:hypothetical protein